MVPGEFSTLGYNSALCGYYWLGLSSSTLGYNSALCGYYSVRRLQRELARSIIKPTNTSVNLLVYIQVTPNSTI